MTSQAASCAKPLPQDYTIAARVTEDTADRYWFFINSGFAVLEGSGQ